jgi:hypothetical protein
MAIAELRQHCKRAGLSDEGTRLELIDRVVRLFQKRMDLLGYGELSDFGKKEVTKIFKQYSSCNEDMNDFLYGITLWDLNRLLMESNSKTVYDNREFQLILKENELLTVNNKLVNEGLYAYYEKMGGLANDIRHLGIGSLNEFLSGHFNCTIEFDREGFESLLPLLSPHTMAENALKRLIRLFSSLQNVKYEAEYENIAELIQAFIMYIKSTKLFYGLTVLETIMKFLDSLLDIVKTPGWPAKIIHKLLESLADLDEGIIRSLRTYVANIFSGIVVMMKRITVTMSDINLYESIYWTGFDNFEPTFEELIKSWDQVRLMQIRKKHQPKGHQRQYHQHNAQGLAHSRDSGGGDNSGPNSSGTNANLSPNPNTNRSPKPHSNLSAPSTPNPALTPPPFSNLDNSFPSYSQRVFISDDDEKITYAEEEEIFSNYVKAHLPPLSNTETHTKQRFTELNKHIERLTAMLNKDELGSNSPMLNYFFSICVVMHIIGKYDHTY